MTDEDPPGAAPASSDPKVTRLPTARARERAQRVTPGDSLEGRRAQVRQLLGPGCPYTPVGYDGRHYWILDCDQHLQQKTARDLSRNEMVSFCGDDTWLKQRYPRMRQGKPVNGFASEDAVAQLMSACKLMGYWQRGEHERGYGAWRETDGDLVVHRGNHLLIKGVRRPLGLYGAHVYTPRQSLPALPEANDRAVARAGQDLLQRLDTFAWRRGSFDSLILHGGICAGFLGGALDFRPHLWITGEFAWGKSTLYALFCALFDAALLAITDGSAAGIRQTINFSSAPVVYDEAEAEADPRRQDAVLKLIRDASSGGRTVRGGAAHEASQFAIQSCFFCSSIIVPPMPTQDRSRFVVLELQRLTDATRVFSIDRLQAIGAALSRRLIERYPALMADVLPSFRNILIARGATRRFADLYGTVFAAAAVSLYDDVSLMNFEKLADGHHIQGLIKESIAELTEEWRRCLDYFLSSPVDRARPMGPTWGDMLERAARPLRHGRAAASGELTDLTGAPMAIGDVGDEESEVASRALAGIGVRLITRLDGVDLREPMVAFASNHRGLADLFSATIWRSNASAVTGGWAQVLRRAPGAITGTRLRFRAVEARVTAVPLSAVLMHDRPRPDATAPPVPEDPASWAGVRH